jgi:hypothetical protein
VRTRLTAVVVALLLFRAGGRRGRLLGYGRDEGAGPWLPEVPARRVIRRSPTAGG